MPTQTEHMEQPKKARFLAAFRDMGSIRAAAEAASVGRTTVYRWQEHDADFLAAFHVAEAEATEYLENVAHRNAVEHPVVEETEELLRTVTGAALLDDDGQPRMMVTKRVRKTELNTTLLIFLLKARAPEKYRERFDMTRSDAPLVKAYAAEDLALL